MSIDDDQPYLPSVTEGDRALALFTDRHEFARLFAECLNEPPQKHILFFYGAGGNGKSLLLRYLQQKCCKRFLPDTWQQVKERSDGELAQFIEHSRAGDNCVEVPSVLIDFAQTRVNERPQDPFYGLLLLRKRLAEAAGNLNHSLRFLRYDFACIWYLHKKGNSPEQIKALFPLTEVAGAITSLIDAVSQTTVGSISKAVFDFFAKDWGQKFTIYLSRTGLSKEQVQEICQKDLDTELIDELPRWFAQDLNVAMEQPEAPKRLMLLFDTHEAFWGHERDLPPESYFYRDEWFRRLLRGLKLESGIGVVVAGQELPRWPEVKRVKPGTEISPEYIVTKLLGNLAEPDAIQYLQQYAIGITGELAQALIVYAKVSGNEVHPLYLGLGADVVVQARNQGIELDSADFADLPEAIEKAEVLINRLLRYVSESVRDAVYALSACRSFDLALYRMLARELNFPPYDANFRQLTGFSFVTAVGQQQFRVHDLLRRLADERKEAKTHAAHRILVQYYQNQKQLVESLFHLNRLDWQEGVRCWGQKFEEALQLEDYVLCRSLMEVRNDFFIKHALYIGKIACQEGLYFQQLEYFEIAEEKYTEAINSLNKLLENSLEKFFKIAINNQGIALAQLGKVRAQLSQYKMALNTFQKAMHAFDAALEKDPSNTFILNNKGNFLTVLGDIQVILGQYDLAKSSYKEAIETFDKGSNIIIVNNNKGKAIASLGDLQVILAQNKDALESYQHAITNFNQILQEFPSNNLTLGNKATVLAKLGKLQTTLSYYEFAIDTYQQAIDTFNEGLIVAPNAILLLSNKGNTLTELGKLQVILSHYEAANNSFQQAIVSFDCILNSYPDHTSVLNNKGITLMHLGELQVKLVPCEAALKIYEQAIVVFDKALEKVSDNIHIILNQANILQSIGDLQKLLFQAEKAAMSYEESIKTLDRALDIVPEDIFIINNKGSALARLGALQADLSQHEKALKNHEKSIFLFDIVLAKTPDNVTAINNKGMALRGVGDMRLRLFDHEEAIVNYQQAIMVFDEGLEKYPNDIYMINNKGKTLQKLGNLMLNIFRENKINEAREYFLKALLLFSRIVEMAPNEKMYRRQRDQLQNYLINSI